MWKAWGPSQVGKKRGGGPYLAQGTSLHRFSSQVQAGEMLQNFGRADLTGRHRCETRSSRRSEYNQAFAWDSCGAQDEPLRTGNFLSSLVNHGSGAPAGIHFEARLAKILTTDTLLIIIRTTRATIPFCTVNAASCRLSTHDADRVGNSEMARHPSCWGCHRCATGRLFGLGSLVR